MKFSQLIFGRIVFVILLFSLAGCEDFLDKKPDQSLVVPSTLKDLQALLDFDHRNMNKGLGIRFVGADNYYLPEGSWETLYTQEEKNGYIWEKDIYVDEEGRDWSFAYEKIFTANVVLKGLKGIEVTSENRSQWEQVKGAALFFRAYSFYNLLQCFAAPYDPETAEGKPGIPLKLNPQVDAPVHRAGLQESYDEVVESLMEAAALLPEIAGYKTRPSQAAAYACLARVFLTMQDYEKARDYASASLEQHNFLLNYAAFDTAATYPFEKYNGEVIFHSILGTYNIFSRAIIDPELYSLYHKDDLRKYLFFSLDEPASPKFKGTYTAERYPFSGLATDEVYLIRAECRARLGDTEGAMADLNTLLETRWKAGAFESYIATNADEALVIILEERRKELLFRGLRWSDLRRLNQDPRFAKTLTRTVDGETYTLPPNDSRYVYPIPEIEIDINGLEQNPR